MKIILNNESKDTINIDEITENYLIVSIYQGEPCILSKGYDEKPKQFTFFSISNNFTIGNGYNFTSKEDTIQKMIVDALSLGYKVEAFHESDWKKALQWLIDNAE